MLFDFCIREVLIDFLKAEITYVDSGAKKEYFGGSFYRSEEDARKALKVHAGWEVNLLAAQIKELTTRVKKLKKKLKTESV
jgi:hypothetical protein